LRTQWPSCPGSLYSYTSQYPFTLSSVRRVW